MAILLSPLALFTNRLFTSRPVCVCVQVIAKYECIMSRYFASTQETSSGGGAWQVQKEQDEQQQETEAR